MQFIKKLFLLVLMLSLTPVIAQQIDVSNVVLSGDNIVNSSTVLGGVLDPNLGQVNSVSVNPTSYIRLQINDDIAVNNSFTVQLGLSVTPLLSNGNPDAVNASTEVMEIEYSMMPGLVVNDLAYKAFENRFGLQVLIDSVQIINTDNASIPITETPENVELVLGFKAEQFRLLSTQLPQVSATTSTDLLTLDFNWQEIIGATSYQLEWTWLDNYGVDAPKTANDIEFSRRDFELNNTRVEISKTNYEIPLVYSNGFIVYRVRAVGVFLTDVTTSYYGKWSTVNSNPLLVSDWEHVEVSSHEDMKNWQFQSSYAEEGKKKEVVSYFDGTLRNRQTVTKINSDDNAIVGEVIYDFQGRPAIEVLPAPTNEATQGNKIKYYPDFNLINPTTPYSKNDFDWDLSEEESCNNVVYPMDTSSGANQYYSADASIDPDKFFQRQVPDAFGYAFSQIEYMPDNTGRIRRKGGVGEAHQLGSGHEMKYYYAKANEGELERLFGDNVGNPSHYKKNMVIDPNGQVSLSYLDPQGRTIATALAGGAPPNIEPIDQLVNASFSVDLLGKNDALATDSVLDSNDLFQSGNFGASYDILKHESVQLSPSEGVDYTLDYTINSNSVFNPSCLPTETGYPLEFDVSFNILDECGKTLLLPDGEIIRRFGNFSPDAPVTLTASQLVSDSFAPIIYPPVGSFTVKKELQINEEALNAYADDYIERLRQLEGVEVNGEICVPDFNSLRAVDLGCYATCQDCVDSLPATVELYIQERINEYDEPLNLTPELEAALTAEYQGLIDTCNEPCLEEGVVDTDSGGSGSEDNLSNSVACANILEDMLSDMSPEGQYGMYYTEEATSTAGTAEPVREHVLNVFNSSNDGIIDYDRDGQLEEFDTEIEDYTETSQATEGVAAVNELFSHNVPSSSTENSWRFPYHYQTNETKYVDANGNESLVEVELNGATYTPAIVTGTTVTTTTINGIDYHYVAPQNLLNLADFLANWEDTWSESLIIYHPEYPYYEYAAALCNATSNIGGNEYNSDAYEAYLTNLSYADASGYFNSVTIINDDPYFAHTLNLPNNGIDESTMRYEIMEEAVLTNFEGSGKSMYDYTLLRYICNT
ncbi:MAG: hypothetical protein HRT68_12895, partial [Flavobacteriaceae bacterium]|nr:hypothetical protein [Flavobacteriaceae bacterium]